MTTAQVVEKISVTVNNNSPIQDYVHLDDHTQPTFEMTPGFNPFTAFSHCWYCSLEHYNAVIYNDVAINDVFPLHLDISQTAPQTF